ncbi:glycosyltransferase family 2 protein [Allorhizobium sp. BGMRC 0089]|uniref:glycosyltransferase family 2 protein n=1 Tax=Allorhizobium sonneratiae TaxID=2934936 RepID=UPI00203412CC|nr:glycosyltransferase family 2 protein [Allorhizobium sonneratiae]MCM2292019.1 glycosyltransferase family 2 protein [Allorhizobium sonneratiae]
MTDGEAATVFALTGEAVRGLSGHPFMLTVHDPAGVLPPLTRLQLIRKGREPSALDRSLIVRGRGCFYGFMPDDLVAVRLPGHCTWQEKQAPRFHLRRLTLGETVLRVLLRRPRMALILFDLLRHGNLKGVAYRLVRAYESLSAPAYGDWLWARDRSLSKADVATPSDIVADPVFLPLVLVTVEGDRALTPAARAALQSQQVTAHRLVETHALFAAGVAAQAEGREVFWLRLPADAVLQPDMLEKTIAVMAAHPDAAGVYTDEDCLTPDGKRHTPFFKPAWNEPLAASGWLPLETCLFRLSMLPQDVDPATYPAHDLALKAAEKGPILHVPEVLVSRGRTSLKKQRPPAAARVRRAPPVSVIIPTRDRADMLKACLTGLYKRTDADALDVIVIDNDSCEAETHDVLHRFAAEHGLRHLPMAGAFNFSRACNLGVAEARHEHVLLLNNDVEPTEPHWLSSMAKELSDPRIGAVGALLLFADGFVQHGGVTLGAGTVARHSFHFHHPEGGEDFGLLGERRDVSAVTAACLLTRRSLWDAVGGMNETDLPVAFNDVDYCLKLREQHYRVLFTPEARLIHHESVSRGRDDTAEKRARFAREEAYMVRRWQDILRNDPFYHPSLSLSAADYTLEAIGRPPVARRGG